MKKSERGVVITVLNGGLQMNPTIVFHSSDDVFTNYAMHYVDSTRDFVSGNVIKQGNGLHYFYIKKYQDTIDLIEFAAMTNVKIYIDNGAGKQRITTHKAISKVDTAYAKYLSHHAKFHSSN